MPSLSLYYHTSESMASESLQLWSQPVELQPYWLQQLNKNTMLILGESTVAYSRVSVAPLKWKKAEEDSTWGGMFQHSNPSTSTLQTKSLYPFLIFVKLPHNRHLRNFLKNELWSCLKHIHVAQSHHWVGFSIIKASLKNFPNLYYINENHIWVKVMFLVIAFPVSANPAHSKDGKSAHLETSTSIFTFLLTYHC